MANKLVTISKNNLPISSDTGEYLFRYRIISDDRNRYSAWSPIYRTLAPTVNQILAANSISSLPAPTFAVQTVGTERVANIYWNIPDVFKDIEKYDVFIKWGSGSWEFFNTVNAGSFSIVKPSSQSATTISVKIQSVVYPKKILESQVLYTLADRSFS
jgi:hypothetical protein